MPGRLSCKAARLNPNVEFQHPPGRLPPERETDLSATSQHLPQQGEREQSVRLLEVDPELGLRVPAAEIRRARSQLRARVRSLPCGRWEVLHDEDDRGRLGFLLLEGVLARDLILAGATCTELLGEGDVVQPWVAQDDDGLVRYHVLWHVLAPVRLALLDEAFAQVARRLAAGDARAARARRQAHRADVGASGAAPPLPGRDAPARALLAPGRPLGPRDPAGDQPSACASRTSCSASWWGAGAHR